MLMIQKKEVCICSYTVKKTLVSLSDILELLQFSSLKMQVSFLFLLIFLNKFISFIFGCAGSSLLHMGFLSSCGYRWLLFIAVNMLLIAVASLVEHRL